MDSGCAKSTVGLNLARQLGYHISETPQSRGGHCFLGPGGERYPNRGDVNFKSLDESSRACVTHFNVAEGVDQALGSIAEANDAKNLVIFDAEGSFLIPGNGPEAAAIRKAALRCRRATKIHRRKNSFYLPLWVQAEGDVSKTVTDAGKKTPFQGQGK